MFWFALLLPSLVPQLAPGAARTPLRSCARAARHRLCALSGDDSGALSDDDSGAASGLNMDLLSQRIQQMAEVCTVRMLILDAMVPGQQLACPVPPQLVETMKTTEQLVMFGVDPRSRSLCTRGVGVQLLTSEETDDGDFEVVLQADRLCEIVELGEDEGSRWLGREAKVRWVSLDTPDETMTDALLARSEGLSVLVDEWEELVRNGGRERSPGQLDGVLRDLGPMPEADAPSARALWIAGLINPLPALGVALEVRPAALMAPTAEMRLQVVEMGLQDSIERLKSPGPTF
jgi:hypothetical protein